MSFSADGDIVCFADFVPQEKKHVAITAALLRPYDKLSRSNEEAKSLSKEDVIEIEGIVREAMPNAIFKVEMLSEDKKHWEAHAQRPCPVGAHLRQAADQFHPYPARGQGHRRNVAL